MNTIYWLRRITLQRTPDRAADNSSLMRILTAIWSVLTLLIPILLTGYLNTQLKLTESMLNTRLEQAKNDLSTRLEETKTALQRASAFYQAREKAYTEIWAIASTIPSQLHQAAVQPSQNTTVASLLDKYNTSYHERSLYLTSSTETILDRTYSDAFAALGGHGSIQTVDDDVRALREDMQRVLTLHELEGIASATSTRK